MSFAYTRLCLVFETLPLDDLLDGTEAKTDGTRRITDRLPSLYVLRNRRAVQSSGAFYVRIQI